MWQIILAIILAPIALAAIGLSLAMIVGITKGFWQAFKK